MDQRLSPATKDPDFRHLMPDRGCVDKPCAGMLTTGEPQGRLELKYCLPELLAADVLDRARGHLVPEPLALGAQQRVTSLYLDTPDLTFLRWHRQRVGDRYKLRIRAYGELPATTLYVELKCKNGQVVRKERGAFPAAIRDAVVAECHARHGATPRMLVSVVRESLRDPGQPTAVTVDRALRYQPTTRIDMIGDAGAWKTLPLPPCAGPAPVLVELKFGADAPLWMAALSEQLAPWRVSFSKYATAMTCTEREPAVSGVLEPVMSAFAASVDRAA